MSISISDQQKLADKVLSYLWKTLDVNAIILGGAPRNWFVGKIAKDLDVYLRPSFNARTVSNYLNSGGYPTKKTGGRTALKPPEEKPESEVKSFLENVEAKQSAGSDFKAVARDQNGVFQTIIKYILTDTSRHTPIQFIVLDPNVIKNNIEMMSTFDFNVCKTAYKSGAIRNSPEFWADYNNKKLTLNVSKMSPDQFKNTPKRFRKMKDLFPGFETDLV